MKEPCGTPAAEQISRTLAPWYPNRNITFMPPSRIASRCDGLSIGLAIRPVTGLRKFPARCFPALVRPRCGSLSPAGKAATSLEFITQREFHYARLCGKSGVIPKCRTVNVEIRVDAQRIETLGDAYRQYVPTHLP